MAHAKPHDTNTPEERKGAEHASRAKDPGIVAESQKPIGSIKTILFGAGALVVLILIVVSIAFFRDHDTEDEVPDTAAAPAYVPRPTLIPTLYKFDEYRNGRVLVELSIRHGVWKLYPKGGKVCVENTAGRVVFCDEPGTERRAGFVPDGDYYVRADTAKNNKAWGFELLAYQLK